jgi:hypothetical protein
MTGTQASRLHAREIERIRKMKAILFLSIFLNLTLAIGVVGQSVYTPEKGSIERKAILDALRVRIERELKQPIVFVTDNFKVQGAWAFVSGTPQSPDGGMPNYNGTKYAAAQKDGFFEKNFFAILKNTAGKWKVSAYAIGCTDVCYTEWWRQYRAPKAIFPYTE